MKVFDDFVVTGAATVFEHGWQSWSPTSTYPAAGRSHRPASANTAVLCYRPGLPPPTDGFQGEGLLGIDPGDGGPVRLYAAVDGLDTVPSIRAELADGRMVVRTDGPVEIWSGADLRSVLGIWAEEFAKRAGAAPPRPAPTVWCSWYQYFTEVTEADIVENLAAIEAHDLPVDVVQIDDGWQRDIGDWLDYSDRFASLADLVRRIRDSGRRAGIWVAPFLASTRSALAREHPDWLVGEAGHNWGAPLAGLDLTVPEVRAHLTEVFGSLRAMGIDYFKIDFLYAGALGPLSAYRAGVSTIRAAIGPDAYLLGCGAPILPSVGLFDAMRVSADVAVRYAPPDGDPSQPSQLGAALSTVGRAFQHGRFWVNDPDCLIVRPEVERREEWASVVERFGGLRASSDRIAALDEWGLATTRRLLAEVPPPTPFG